jgi:NTE family protein
MVSHVWIHGAGQCRGKLEDAMKKFMSYTDWSKTHTHIIPGNFGDKEPFTDLLFFDQDSGMVSLSSIERGLLSPLSPAPQKWTPGARKLQIGANPNPKLEDGVHLEPGVLPPAKTPLYIIVSARFGNDVNHTDVLLYDPITGGASLWRYEVGSLNQVGTSQNLPLGITHIVAGNFAGDNRFTNLFLYNQITGETSLWTYELGSINQVGIPQNLSPEFTHVVAGNFAGDDKYTDLFLYNQSTGEASFWTYQTGNLTQIGKTRTWTPGSAKLQIGANPNPVLPGGVHLDAGVLPLPHAPAPKPPNYIIIAGKFGGFSNYTDLLLYNQNNGEVSFWTTGEGDIALLGKVENLSPGITRIIAGNFWGTGSSILTYQQSEGTANFYNVKTIAIVLSGGGSKGDFELGVIQYLYDQGIRPDILCGTSVGAINAVKLAEGEGRENQGLQSLKSIWFNIMKSDSDMFLPQPWLDNKKHVKPEVKKLIINGLLERPNASASLIETDLKTLGLWNSIAGPIAYEALDFVTNDKSIKSVFNLDPITNMLQDYFDPELVKTWSDKGKRKLRLAMVSLDSGKLRYVTENGELVERDNTTILAENIDLRDATRASSTMAIFFNPKELNGEFYVDGGHREITPVQVAIDLGATDIYAIQASKAGLDYEKFADLGLLDIATRMLDIFLTEIDHDDITIENYRDSTNIIIIRPSYEVHKVTDVDPGLIRIQYDYGYMRAADILSNSDNKDDLINLTEQIIQNRHSCWREEYFANGIETMEHIRGYELVPVASPDSLRRVRKSKKDLKKLVDARRSLGGSFAPDTNVEAWWKNWEVHSWKPFFDSPWEYFVSRAGAVEAETPP